MRFHVNWLPNAEQELAEIWLNAPDRSAVTWASDQIDRRLQKDPDSEGESRSDGQRLLIVLPLAAVFQVFGDDLRVDVIHVWKFFPPPSAP
jgi:hypothetical protein